jgi:S1-C subfamily serine protease
MWQNRPYLPDKPPLLPESPDPPPRLKPWRDRLLKIYRRWQIALFIGLGIIIAFSGTYLYGRTLPPPQKITQKDIDNAVIRALASASPTPSFESQVFSIIQPSVVSIEVKVKTAADGKIRTALGTGVVVDEDGTILTCLHVVNNASQIQITFYDGTESAAVISASLPENDMAILTPEVIPDNLVPAVLASASVLNIGDHVVAVGGPFGITDSLTSGVVSGMERSFKSPETGLTLTHLIQFDAAVNPGSSGGPLLDRYGEVVGIVDALLNPTGQEVFIGIGFAVTIEAAAGALGSPWY